MKNLEMNKGIIGDLFSKGIFTIIEEDILLRGIIAKHIAENFCKRSDVDTFEITDVRIKIQKGYEVESINKIMVSNGCVGCTHLIDKEYCKEMYHNVFTSGGILNSLNIEKKWDGEFGDYFYVITASIRYEKEVLETTALTTLLNKFKKYADSTAPGVPNAFGYSLEPWSLNYPLLSKLNITSALNELLSETKVKSLEVEVINGIAYIFYQFYPTFVF